MLSRSLRSLLPASCLLLAALLAAPGSVPGLVAPAAAEEATAPHPFSAHDLVSMDRLSDPQVSPDGRWVAFVLRSTDFEANRGRTDLWLVGVDGEGLRRLTTHEAGDFNPRWSPDGRFLYFLSSRSGSSQVWRLPLAGGEAAAVTELPLDVANLVVSPDGRTLAFSMEVFGDCDTLACTAERLAKSAEGKTTGRLYERLFIRHWDTWKDGRRSHLFVHAVDGDASVARDVTADMDADVPSKPFGGPEEVAFTADGQSLIFSARTAGAEEPWSTNFDLFQVPVDGSAAPRNLTAANPAWDTQPVVSPDGKTLAYLAMERPGYEADRFRIVLKSLESGEERVLTHHWDRSPGGLVFSPDGGTLYATAGDLGQVALFAVDLATGAVRRLVAEGHVRSPAVAGDRLVFGRDTLTAPVDLYTSRLDGSDLRPITRLNADRLSQVDMGEPEQLTFKGWNDETVHAYLVKPVGFDSSKKYPIAFLIHGGPQGSFGNDFHYRWNPQTYAGAGYAALMVDFHGSTGYGQGFTDSIRGDWGGKPLEDLKKGMAAALARYPWLDGDRACALGASYGGYMINWIAGNWPDGFRCLVNHDGLFDLRMMYYSTEELWFPEWDQLGPYFENPESHERFNPANFVTRWRTPMLVVHGGQDFRVPETQGFATFTALQRRGIESQFLYFPNENHWVLQPANSLQWHEAVLGWLGRWLEEP